MARNQSTQVGGVFTASQFNFVAGSLLIGNAATGAQTVTLNVGYIMLQDGTQVFPYATNAPLIFDIGTPQETVTPSAVTGTTIPGVGLASGDSSRGGRHARCPVFGLRSS